MYSPLDEISRSLVFVPRIILGGWQRVTRSVLPQVTRPVGRTGVSGARPAEGARAACGDTGDVRQGPGGGADHTSWGDGRNLIPGKQGHAVEQSREMGAWLLHGVEEVATACVGPEESCGPWEQSHREPRHKT